MNLDPGLMPKSYKDLARWQKSVEDRLQYLSSSRNFIERASVDGGVVTISQILRIGPTPAGFVAQTVTGFGVSAAGANLVTAAVTVPPQMTGCAVLLVGRVYAVNSTASDDYLFARAEIGATTGNALPVLAGPSGDPNEAALNNATVARVLTGLTPGAAFPVRLWAKTDTADWASDAANTADLSGVISWFA